MKTRRVVVRRRANQFYILSQPTAPFVTHLVGIPQRPITSVLRTIVRSIGVVYCQNKGPTANTVVKVVVITWHNECLFCEKFGSNGARFRFRRLLFDSDFRLCNNSTIHDRCSTRGLVLANTSETLYRKGCNYIGTEALAAGETRTTKQAQYNVYVPSFLHRLVQDSGNQSQSVSIRAPELKLPQPDPPLYPYLHIASIDHSA